MLFDAHTHLNFSEFTDEEREILAEEIATSDVAKIVDVADSVESAKQALLDAERYPWCFAAVGIHPDKASTYTDTDIEEIRRLYSHPKAVAIGEIGMDLYYGKESKEKQIELFSKQIRLAIELNAPIMVHSRDADKLTMDILMSEGAFSEDRKSKFPLRPVSKNWDYPKDARVQLHCYSGSAEFAAEYVKLGATISLAGPVTFKNGKKPAEVARLIPIEFLLSETDAPYMSPEPLRGRQNKSQYIEHIVRRIALIKEMRFEDASRILSENGLRFFNIDSKCE